MGKRGKRGEREGEIERVYGTEGIWIREVE